MIKFDFSTYMDSKVEVDTNEKQKLLNKIYNSPMAGFYNNVISTDEINKIKSVSKKIPLHRTICTMQGLHSGYYPLNPPRRGRFQTSASRANLHPCSSDARRAAPHGGCVPGAA